MTSKLQFVPFKIFSVESNTLLHTLRPAFHASLERFFWNPPEFGHHSSFDGVNVRKTSSLDHPLQLGEEKKVTGCQVWRIGRLVEYGDLSFSEKLLNTEGLVSGGIVMVQDPSAVFPLVSPLVSHRPY